MTASVEKQQTKLSERYLVATAATARVSLWHPVTQGKYCFGAKRVVFLIKENPLPFRFKVSFLYKSKSRYYNSFQFELTFNYLIICFYRSYFILRNCIANTWISFLVPFIRINTNDKRTHYCLQLIQRGREFETWFGHGCDLAQTSFCLFAFFNSWLCRSIYLKIVVLKL